MPNGTYGGVRGEKFIKNYPLLDYRKLRNGGNKDDKNIKI